MSRELKVWSGHLGGRERAIVSATSRKEAVGIMESYNIRMSVGEMSAYWSETGNDEALAAAAANPKKLLVEAKPWSKVFVEYGGKLP